MLFGDLADDSIGKLENRAWASRHDLTASRPTDNSLVLPR